MKKAIKLYLQFDAFVKSLKRRGIYEFTLKQFCEFNKNSITSNRRFLIDLEKLNLIKSDFYFKTNKKKYLIIK